MAPWIQWAQAYHVDDCLLTPKLPNRVRPVRSPPCANNRTASVWVAGRPPTVYVGASPFDCLRCVCYTSANLTPATVQVQAKQEPQFLTLGRPLVSHPRLSRRQLSCIHPVKNCVSSPDFLLRRFPRSAGTLSRETQTIRGHSPGRMDFIARPSRYAPPAEDRTRINEQIRVRQVRVIDEEGNQLGIMRPEDAMREAEERGFDLVEVAPQGNPPVCRIMDYGKFRYEQKRRIRESRKNQHTVSVKEIKYRPKIDIHDFDYKTNHVREFLKEGNKVKVTIMFRGREMAHPEFGRDILQRVLEGVRDLCSGEYSPQQTRLEGRNMSMVLNPIK